MSNVLEWATRSGDAWASRWRETDRALAGLAPALQAALVAAAPSGAFRAFDIGCGPGSTTMALALARPDATMVACDLSPALVQVARKRLDGFASVEVVLGDAAQVVLERGPFDLLYSRHGVMFFPDPFAAFAKLRRAASAGAKLVFSCFQDWNSNPWASELASAAAGAVHPAPGREPSGFAFADPDYVREILTVARWEHAEPQAVRFAYAAAEGETAVEEALSFLCEIGPASGVVRAHDGQERADAVKRMRGVIEAHFDGDKVEFEAAAWVWTATAGAQGATMNAASA